jgi:hypothetical protein
VALVVVAAVVIAMLQWRSRPAPPVAPAATTQGAATELTQAQRTAVEKMRTAAEAARAGVKDLEEIRARSPEFLELMLAYDRKVLAFELLLYPSGPARLAASDTFLARATATLAELEKRRDLDATRASLLQAQYAVAEGRFLKATAEAGHGTDGGTPRTLPERSAAEAMLGAARGAYAALLELEEIRARSPEFLDLELAYLRSTLEAQLRLYPPGAERTAALGKYLAETQEVQKKLEKRRDLDATRASISRAAFAVAEARYFQAADAAGHDPRHPGALTAVEHAAAEEMLTLAREALRGLMDLVEIRARSPEFLEAQLEAQRTVLEAALCVYAAGPERSAALERHVAATQEVQAMILARRDLDATRASVAQAAYAVAEAEFLRTTNGSIDVVSFAAR